jgi:hypothetical protein
MFLPRFLGLPTDGHPHMPSTGGLKIKPQFTPMNIQHHSAHYQ